MGICSFRLMAIGRCTQVRSLLVGRDVFEYVAIIFESKCLVYGRDILLGSQNKIVIK